MHHNHFKKISLHYYITDYSLSYIDYKNTGYCRAGMRNLSAWRGASMEVFISTKPRTQTQHVWNHVCQRVCNHVCVGVCVFCTWQEVSHRPALVTVQGSVDSAADLNTIKEKSERMIRRRMRRILRTSWDAPQRSHSSIRYGWGNIAL